MAIRYRYFYEKVTFTKTMPPPKEGEQPDLYYYEGFDVRSLSFLGERVEISKEEYEARVKEDKAIVKAFWNNFRIKIETFHNPQRERV